MPKKGGAKKKAKAPSFLTDAASCEPFGFMPNDIIVTPLGLEVVVVGVKKTDPTDPIGTLWAQFQGGYTSPLRPKNATEFEEQGYRKAHQGMHIMRDKAQFEVKRQELLHAFNPIVQAEEKAAKEAKKTAKGAKAKKKK